MLSLDELKEQFEKLAKINKAKFSVWTGDSVFDKPVIIEENLETGETKTHNIEFPKQ